MRFTSLYFIFLSCAIIVTSPESGAAKITKIVPTKTELIFSIDPLTPTPTVLELAPFQHLDEATHSTFPKPASRLENSSLAIPRFDGERDRLYSGFALVLDGAASGPIRFVEKSEAVSLNRDPYPDVKSKKGLQVQQVDDAIALGVKHAALNFNLAQMVALEPAPNDFSWKMDGQTFSFRRGYVEHLDQLIKTYSEAGATVSLILLNYVSSNDKLNKLLLHPGYDKACPNHLSAFNTSTAEAVSHFTASMEFLAARYSEAGYPHGRVVNYIVGNEVNSHWYWANMGRVSMEQFAADYLRAVRLCHTAVRKYSSSARVFISLEHHWNIRYPGCDEKQGFAGEPFVKYFNVLAMAGGNFDWHIAYHPYPESLFNPRTWNDKSATFAQDTPRITFKNLEMLPLYLQRSELLFDGKPRRIILSEQGFHSDGTPEGELAQAAGYCYAYYKADQLPEIDSFILHRHVDHGHEGGLNLGLWRRDTNSPSASMPLSKKPIYEVFRAADTPEWEKAFEFALPIIGIKSWKEIEPRRSKK